MNWKDVSPLVLAAGLAGCAGSGNGDKPVALDVCLNGECRPAAGRFAKEELIGGLLMMLKANEGLPAELCETAGPNKPCARDSLSFFVQGGPLPAFATLSKPQYAQVALDKSTLQIKLTTAYSVTWAGTPVFCQDAYTEITVANANDVLIESPSYACMWTAFAHVWNNKYQVGLIDFDKGVIAGTYKVAGGGMVTVGGGSGNFRITLPKARAWAADSAPQLIPAANLPANVLATPFPQAEAATSPANTQAIDSTRLAAMRQERRVALVIGNADYRIGALGNPVNDARDVEGMLRSLGFEVVKVENGSLPAMMQAIDTFGQRIRGAGVGLFFYAGHGLQVKGENYLVPVDANMRNEAEVRYKAVNVGLVLAQLEEAKSRVNVVILDACRDNPFARSFRSQSSGLAAIDAPQGTMIVYSTAPGRVASDGPGRNGLYTEELLRIMNEPGVKIEDALKRVRTSVRQRSKGEQVPWEASSMEGDFFFRLP